LNTIGTTRCTGSKPVEVAELAERDALDILHRHVRDPLVDHRLEHAHDVRMVEPARDRTLGLEDLAQPAADLLVVAAHLDDLERDLAIVMRVVGEVDDRRRPAADLARDVVATDRRRSGLVIPGRCHRADWDRDGCISRPMLAPSGAARPGPRPDESRLAGLEIARRNHNRCGSRFAGLAPEGWGGRRNRLIPKDFT
jgi:hypothetical protein